jgi:hypothetical protein
MLCIQIDTGKIVGGNQVTRLIVIEVHCSGSDMGV